MNRPQTTVTASLALLVASATSAFGARPRPCPELFEEIQLNRVPEQAALANEIARCPDLDARYDNGFSLLDQAVSNGRLDVVKALVEAGAGNRSGALEYALVGRQSYPIAKYLVDHGAGFLPNHISGSTPIEAQIAKDIEMRDQPPAPAPAAAAPAVTREDMKRMAQDAAREAAREAAKAAAAASPAPAPAAATGFSSDADAPRYKLAVRPDDFAVVVGVERYNDLPEAKYAERDAAAVHAHLLALGYPERNIVQLTGAAASKAGLLKNLETRLPALVKEDSTVFFYYSGHGAPDAATGKAYLLPADGDPQYLEDTGYPLARLYQKLGALRAKRVIVALDSCFSGAGGRSVLAPGTRPLVTRLDTGRVPAKIVALTASAANQISGTLDEQGHGAFTYYLLRGLNGAAKDADGRVTVSSLYDYVAPNVQDAARRQNRDQQPQLAAADKTLQLR